MAYEIPLFKLGIFPADVDLSLESADQFAAVKIAPAANTQGAGNGVGSALSLPTAGGKILGILQNNPIVGEAGEVTVHGVSKVKAGGSFVAGDFLMTDGTGKLVLATTGNRAVAQALEAGVSGAISSALIQDYGIV
jgi:hypothetical protein